MNVDELMAGMEAILNEAPDRTLTDDEVGRYENLESELNAARRDAEVRSRQRAYSTPVASLGAITTTERSNPLAYTRQALDGLQDAIRERRVGRFDGDTITNVALTTTTYGAPSEWGAAELGGPRLLHVAAGVPTTSIDAITAEFPEISIPSAGVSVSEGISLTEYASVTGGSVVLGRFGKFTEVTGESQMGTSAAPIVAAHQLFIAKSLDKALIDKVNTQAGVAVAFQADVTSAIRKALAEVTDDTAASSVNRLVVLVHSDNVALLEDIAPVSGSGIGEGFSRFSGALVYVSKSVPTGFALVANLVDSVKYFTAQGIRTLTDVDIRSDVLTIATATVAGYAIGLVGGSAKKIDIVTP